MGVVLSPSNDPSDAVFQPAVGRVIFSQPHTRARPRTPLRSLAVGHIAVAAAAPTPVDAVSEGWRRLLMEYNAHTNVYSRGAYDQLPTHIADSWNVAERVKGGAVLDLGSGSGLPAVFVAAHPEAGEVFAVESKSRKTRFLAQVQASLGLDRLHVVTADIAELCRRSAFDVRFVTAKAFKKLPEVVAAAEACVAGPSTLVVPHLRGTSRGGVDAGRPRGGHRRLPLFRAAPPAHRPPPPAALPLRASPDHRVAFVILAILASALRIPVSIFPLSRLSKTHYHLRNP
eukprot:TRINITY_DN7533_c0_g1_i1.p1 TRINITY_DN7533_c0_g1~~TRINITY_DN7533_c0_g1_i1.p1  ORF type:complete len:320 (-),score=31.34 TRINITY_DN7533_c0_g1_i1:36-893(-)